MKVSPINIILFLLLLCLIVTGVAFWQSGELNNIFENNYTLLSWLVPLIIIIFGALTSLISWFILFMAAFNDSTVTGLLFFFITPFYPLYFALSKYKSRNKAFVLIGWIGGILIVIVSNILLPFSLLSVIQAL